MKSMGLKYGYYVTKTLCFHLSFKATLLLFSFLLKKQL